MGEFMGGLIKKSVEGGLGVRKLIEIGLGVRELIEGGLGVRELIKGGLGVRECCGSVVLSMRRSLESSRSLSCRHWLLERFATCWKGSGGSNRRSSK